MMSMRTVQTHISGLHTSTYITMNVKLVGLGVGVVAAVIVVAYRFFKNRPQYEGGYGGSGRGGYSRQPWATQGAPVERQSPPSTVRRRSTKKRRNDEEEETEERKPLTQRLTSYQDDNTQRKPTSADSHDVGDSGPRTDDRLVNAPNMSAETDTMLPVAKSTPADSNVTLGLNPSTKNTLMQVPEHSIGVWIFGEDNFFTTLPKVWTVSDCIKHVRNKIGNFGYGDLDLWIRNRCIMLNKGKTLSDYPGLKSLYVIRRPRSRDPHPFHQTPRCDDTDPFSDDTCVLMPCGHAISPENLYEYAWSKIQNGGIGVTCPAVPDAKRPSEQCSTIWDFTSVSKLACLSNDENCLFCCQLFSNFVEAQPNIHLCPVCNEAIYSDCATVFKCFNCEKSGTSFSFCVHCHRPIYGRECVNDECQESVPRLKTLLKNCPTRTLVNVPNCPSVRACPKCNCVIEYDEEDSCKHMTCPRNSCQTQFCFICLKVKTDKYYWPCGGAYEPCSPSPRQIM
ncbi:uncharacterized protein [Argopecten irradians]|uniref:uncharacterized protein isoform X3 n=1 Tax=Argopecten irradians TaxID=31199 RepID=UPI003721513A